MKVSTLKKRSLKLYPGMEVCWPQYGGRTEQLPDMAETIESRPQCYCINNSVICFTSDGAAYVTPYSSAALGALTDEGYMPSDLYVPFSNWDYPVAERDEWERLCRRTREFPPGDPYDNKYVEA